MAIQSIRRRIENAITPRARGIFSLLFLAVLILGMNSSSASGQTGYAIYGQAITPSGTPAANARITACLYTATGTPCSPRSTIYSDPALTVPLTQPYAANQYGNYSFWVAPGGAYLIQIQVSQTVVYSYFTSSGVAAPSGIVSSIIPGTNITCSTLVSGSCTGAVTINSAFPYPAGSGIPQVVSGTSWGTTYDASNTIPLNFMGTGTPASGKYVDGGTGAWTLVPAAGLTSLNSQTGPAVTLQSAGATVAITNPSANVINLEAGSGGLTSINSQTGPAITVHSSDSSVTVTTTTNDIDLTTAAAGNCSASDPACVQYAPANQQYYLIGSSQLIHTTDDLSPTAGTTLTYTGGSCNGTTWTVTATNTLTAGFDWVLQTDNATLAPACLGVSVVPVLTASSTQFTFSEAETSCTGAQTITAGTAYRGTYLPVAQISRQPFFANHGTVHQVPEATYYETIRELTLNYTTVIHPHTTAVTGLPTTFYIMGGFIDLGLNTSGFNPNPAATEGFMQTLWNDLHADGVTIVEITNYVGSPRIADGDFWKINNLNGWVTTQYAPATSYVDNVIDVASKIANYSNSGSVNTLYADKTHLSNAGNRLFASIINRGMASQGSLNEQASPSNGVNTYFGAQMIYGVQGAGIECPILAGVYSTTAAPADFSLCTSSTRTWFNSVGNLASASIWSSGTSTMFNVAGNNGVWGWMNGVDPSFSTIDTGLNRLSAGVVGVGNGGKTDTSGTLKAASLFASGLGSSTNPVCTTTGGQLTNSGCVSASAFSALTSGTNTTAAMVVGSGASLAPTGTGTVQANVITGTVPFSSPIVITGTGTVADPYVAGCPSCGTSSGGTNVSQNSGAAEANLPITGFMPQLCADSSGSGTVQSCTVANTFVPQTGNCIVYSTTTANSGTGLTVNVNSLGAKSVAVAGSSGWTTTLVASSSIAANKPLHMCYDGTNWNASGTGFAVSSGYPTPVTLTASSSAELDFTTCMTASYDDYQIRYQNVVPATNTVLIYIQVSTNGGSTYDSTAADYWAGWRFNQMGANSGGDSSSTGGTTLGIPIGTGVVNTSSLGISGTAVIYGVNSASNFKSVTYQTLAPNASTFVFNGGAQYKSTTAVNAFRVIASSGNLASGSVTCQPLPK